MTKTVVVAGATGDLGARVVRELLRYDIRLRVLARPGSGAVEFHVAGEDRVDVVTAAYHDHSALREAVSGADVVVSTINGLRPVIIDSQRALLKATVEAGVPRFIPSDYSADYRRIDPDSNRNFELRREFAAEVDATPIHATSILNGMFTDLLTGAAPMILFDRRKVLYWSNADQVLDFTTKNDAARMTALAALDDQAPRVIEIAGSQVSARDIAETLTELTGTDFSLQWAGTTGSLSAMSKTGRLLSKSSDQVFPAWQGMQYFVSMFSGQAQLHHVYNERYGAHTWTTVRDVLQRHLTAATP